MSAVFSRDVHRSVSFTKIRRGPNSLLSSFGRQSPPRRTPPPCHLAEFRGEAFGICATLLTAYFGCQRSSVGFSSVTLYSKPQIQSQQGRPGRASVSLSPTFFIATTQQQRFKLIKCLLLIGPDRLEDDTGAAIQIGTKHFQYAGGREILIAFANRDLALKPDDAPDKMRRRSRVQPELVDNFDFFAHAVQSGGSHQTHDGRMCFCFSDLCAPKPNVVA